MKLENFFSFIIYFLITIFILINFYSFYEEKLYPAYLSYYTDCPPENLNQTQFLSERGYYVSATFNPNDNNITLITPDESSIKHEFCHLKQKLYGRFYSCNQPVFKYLNELEAYISEDFPNNLYFKIYGNYSI